ncbi:uncharacterized protein DNG_07655 [Cephalotrichum gorgonifer]|uniref:Uncharacterized protein n=1 Tax=Cephalotrichum gorgonifer TaxID=2041049 RepID=A0AAE8N266_9PEZI|nr:uncharacterized protein DNG_07655 [Cephalotrichum gorgonifer]
MPTAPATQLINTLRVLALADESGHQKAFFVVFFLPLA